MRPIADPSRVAVVMSWALGMLVTPNHIWPAWAQPINPMPLEPGWTVREFADVFFTPSAGLAYDPVSTDLFVTGVEAGGINEVYRITQSGVKTAIFSEFVSAFDYQFSYLAFDPDSRIVYFNPGGSPGAPQIIRKIDEFGNFIEDVTAPADIERLFGMTFAPDGKLYVNSIEAGQISTDIARYNEEDDTITTVFPAVGVGQIPGLTFDREGNAYVNGGTGVLKIDISGSVTAIAWLNCPSDVTFGDGSVFTANPCATGNIWRVAADGSGRSRFATGHGLAEEVYFASNGRLYVADHFSYSIWEYSYVPEPATTLTLLIGALLLFRRRSASDPFT